MKLKILFVEDHPTMVEGYKTLLLQLKEYDFEFFSARNCEEAYEIISSQVNRFDLIILDLILPPFVERNILSGEDLGKYIRLCSTCKIVVITSHVEKLLLYSVSKNVNPEGLLVKSDFSSQEFIFTIRRIINGEKVYSNSTALAVKEVTSEYLFLDGQNRKILKLLSEGVRTKNMPEKLNLSISAIDKRKSFIRDYLGVSKGSDEDIINAAKSRNLI